jgi:hypothetical protein
MCRHDSYSTSLPLIDEETEPWRNNFAKATWLVNDKQGLTPKFDSRDSTPRYSLLGADFRKVNGAEGALLFLFG